MARKKKRRPTTRRRSSTRRRGALGNIDVTDLMYSGAGGLAARLIDRIVPSTVDPKIVSAGKIAVGFVLPMVVKDAKTKKILTAVGSGMVAVALVDLVTQFGIMTGLGIGTPPPPDNVEELAVAIEGIDEGNVNGHYLGVSVLDNAAKNIPVINKSAASMSVLNGNMQMQDRMIMA